MAKPRNNAVDLLVYVVLRTVTAVLHALPLEILYRGAALVAAALYRLDRPHRERALGHLRRSFPHWDERRIERTARASMRSLAWLGVEFLLTARKITPQTWRRHVRLHNVSEALRLLCDRDKGAIFLTGHFGNWEVMGYTLAVLGFDSVAVARPLDNPYVNAWALGLREKGGLRILDKKGAAMEVDGLLAGGGTVGFIADQDAGRRGLFVDFFGRPASTFKSIALLAMRHEVPVVVSGARRLAPRFAFEIAIGRIIHPHHWAGKQDPMRWITQEYTAALEAIVRRYPDQYLWVHRRWKHRPKGQADPEDGIG